jgi:hypothetical protein
MMTFVPRRIALSRLFPTIGFQIIIESRSTEDFPGLEIDKCLVRPPSYLPLGEMQKLFSEIAATGRRLWEVAVADRRA